MKNYVSRMMKRGAASVILAAALSGCGGNGAAPDYESGARERLSDGRSLQIAAHDYAIKDLKQKGYSEKFIETYRQHVRDGGVRYSFPDRERRYVLIYNADDTMALVKICDRSRPCGLELDFASFKSWYGGGNYAKEKLGQVREKITGATESLREGAEKYEEKKDERPRVKKDRLFWWWPF